MDVNPPKVQVIPIDQLKPWDRNPRKGHATAAIRRSIKAFGYLSPIIVQAGTMRVLAGHGRLSALKKEGVKDIPVIIAPLSDTEADAFTIADNKIGDASQFDLGDLAAITKTMDREMALLAGFADDDLKKLEMHLRTTTTVTEHTRRVHAEPTDPKEMSRAAKERASNPKLIELANRCYIQVRRSPLHGVGVFALRKIPAGFSPFLPNGLKDETHIMNLTTKEYSAAPAYVKHFVDVYGIDNDGADGKRMVAFPRNDGLMDVRFFVNHSDEPNIKSEDGSWSALCEINEDEELTQNYSLLEGRPWNPNGDRWLRI